MAVRTGVTGLDFLHRRRRPSTRRRRRHQKRGQPRHSHSRAARPLQYPHGESKEPGLPREKREDTKRRLQIRPRKANLAPLSIRRPAWAPQRTQRGGFRSKSRPCPPRSSLPYGLCSGTKAVANHRRRTNPDALPCPSPPLLSLTRLPAALLRRLPVLRDHQRPPQAAERPRCRQGFEVHAQPASRDTRLQRAHEDQVGGPEAGGSHQEAAPGRERQVGGETVTGRGYSYLYARPHLPPAHAHAHKLARRPPEASHPGWLPVDAGWL